MGNIISCDVRYVYINAENEGLNLVEEFFFLISFPLEKRESI